MNSPFSCQFSCVASTELLISKMFLQFLCDMVRSDNVGGKMEPWMIDMLAGNGGGSHDLEMHGINTGGSHDVQVVETQYGSPQEEQVFREAAVVEATTGVKGNKKRSKNFSVNRTVLVSPQKLPMQDLMVGRRRKNACAKVKTPSLLLQTFTWMLWRICGLRRKRWKR